MNRHPIARLHPEVLQGRRKPINVAVEVSKGKPSSLENKRRQSGVFARHPRQHFRQNRLRIVKMFRDVRFIELEPGLIGHAAPHG